jgi:hypothetical protein
LPDDSDSPLEPFQLSDVELLQIQIAAKASLVKHGAFSNEAEYRLIAPSNYLNIPEVVEFRASRSTVIPYLSVHLPERYTESGSFHSFATEGYFIKEVIVGPSPNPDLTVRALNELFERQRADEVQVHGSDVPYRDL